MPIIFKDLSGNGQGVKRGVITKKHTSSSTYDITQHDTNNEDRPFRALVNGDGAAGSITIVNHKDATETFDNVQPGAQLNVQGIRVKATGTTLTTIHALC